MEVSTSIPTTDQVRLELQARLLADALRLTTLYGPEKVAKMIGKSAVSAPSLVGLSFNGYPGVPKLEDFDLDSIHVGQLAMMMYEYAFNYRHPIGINPDVFSAEVEALEDFAIEFRSETYELFLSDRFHTRGAEEADWQAVPLLCQHTRARLTLDMGDDLPIAYIALLSRMSDRAVRNAVSAKGEQRLNINKDDYIDNDEARRWLNGRRGFVATKFQDVTQNPGEHPVHIASIMELGRYLNARWAGLGKTPETVTSELGWGTERLEYLKNIQAEPHRLDPRDCEALAKSLLVSSAWFTEQVMNLLFPRQMDLIMQQRAAVLPANVQPAESISVASVVDMASEFGNDKICTRLMFVLHDGTKLFPAKMKNRDSKIVAYRLSGGGKGGNTLEAGQEVTEEDQMIDLVVKQDFSVRMAGDKSGLKNLYKLHGRAVQAGYLDGQLLA
jgi:hypothetical protein